MPFVSRAQQKWGNSPTGKKALGGQASVNEWNASTPKGSLPNKVTKKHWPTGIKTFKRVNNGSW